MKLNFSNLRQVAYDLQVQALMSSQSSQFLELPAEEIDQKLSGASVI